MPWQKQNSFSPAERRTHLIAQNCLNIIGENLFALQVMVELLNKYTNPAYQHS